MHSLPFETHQKYLDFTSSYVEDLSPLLREISLTIHDNPELSFKEYIAHKTLTTFLKTRKGWEVTPSAYGLDTAFVAVFDSGKAGSVVSYNAEYGMFAYIPIHKAEKTGEVGD